MEKISSHKRVKSALSTKSDKVSLSRDKDDKYIIQHICSINGKASTRKYIKDGLLGSGGFANCYIVQNLQTKKRAAAKIVMKDMLTTYQTKLRLRNQIKIHKTLHHPNIVEFYHYFEDKNNVYLFLQICENQSLNQLIKNRQVFTTPQIQSFVYGIIQGLIYLHSKHIIHRDLKLGNLFVDGSLNIKIGDFGLSTKLEFEKQFKRTICGTPNYIAPEILSGKGYHFQVDIWSVGVIIYTLYMGYPPFQTQQANLTYKKIKQCDYMLPSRSQGVPAQAISLIKSILVKNPSDRPTLQDILQSDFLKLGKGIPINLPKVCITKAPSRKDFNENSFMMRRVSKNQLKGIVPLQTQSKFVKSQQKCNELLYIREINELPNNKYIYELSNNQRAVIQKDKFIFFRNKKNKLIRLNMLKSSLECLTNTASNKFIQQCQTNKQNFKELTVLNAQFKDFVYVNKITKYKDFYMLRLNNYTVELLFQNNHGIFITYPQQIYYFNKNNQLKWVNANDILKCNIPQINIQKQKLQYIKGILLKLRDKQSRQLSLFI